MRDLVIMPAMAQRRESLNMGEFAEEAIIVEEVAAPKRVNHFIEANTQEVTLQHLQQDCIIPSFASMEETISHQSFIGAVVDAAKDYFHGEQFDMPEIRISHPINGRIPSALGKKASELTDEEKTLFYQRMCFCFEIPSIVHDEYGNRLALSIGGVRAYNEINLYSKKSVERFKIFIGFRNRVCSNLMLTTDGLQDKIEVLSVQELYAAALNLFHAYNPSKDLHLLRTLGTDVNLNKRILSDNRQNEIISSSYTQPTETLTSSIIRETVRLMQLAEHSFLMRTSRVQGTALQAGSS